MSIICPKCNKDDQVQKVSVIYESGTTTGSYHGPVATVTHSDGKLGSSGSYVTGVSSSSTHLAQRLAPPTKPLKPSFTCSYYAGVGMAVIFGICLLPTLIGSLAYGMSGDVRDGMVFAIWIPLTLVVVGIVMAKKGWDGKKQQDTEHPKLMADWNKQIDTWNNLFYCHRDGTAFDQRE